MMIKERSTNICKFHDSGAGVLLLGRDQTSHTVKIHCVYQNLLLSLLLGINRINWVYNTLYLYIIVTCDDVPQNI